MGPARGTCKKERMTKPGVQMPPNAPANAGRESVRAWSRAFLEAFRAAFTLSQRLPGGTWGIARDIWNTDHPLPGTGP